jgi:hypothetical protein
MKIGYGAVLPLPPDEAFAFVADPVNWPLFFLGVRSVDKGEDWGRVGGHARLTSVVLGRSLTMDLELTEWDPPRSFRYMVSQGGKLATTTTGGRSSRCRAGPGWSAPPRFPPDPARPGPWTSCNCSSFAECSGRRWPGCRPQQRSISGPRDHRAIDDQPAPRRLGARLPSVGREPTLAGTAATDSAGG